MRVGHKERAVGASASGDEAALRNTEVRRNQRRPRVQRHPAGGDVKGREEGLDVHTIERRLAEPTSAPYEVHAAPVDGCSVPNQPRSGPFAIQLQLLPPDAMIATRPGGDDATPAAPRAAAPPTAAPARCHATRSGGRGLSRAGATEHHERGHRQHLEHLEHLERHERCAPHRGLPSRPWSSCGALSFPARSRTCSQTSAVSTPAGSVASISSSAQSSDTPEIGSS
jgi:hypothetical protein